MRLGNDLDSSRSGGPLSVYLVEDEMIIAMQIRQTLERLGFRVIGHARNGRTAVTETRSLRPDLVLMDIKIAGEMDGIATAEEMLRSISTAVVFQTASSDQVTLDRAKQVQPYGFVVKPFDNFEIQKTLEMAHLAHRKDIALRRERKLLRTLIDTLPAQIYAKDDQHRMVLCNATVLRDRGVNSLEDILGTTDDDFFPAPLAARYRQDEREILEGRTEIITQEEPTTGQDGRPMWVHTTKVPVRGADGSVELIVGINFDITARRQLEERLAASEARFRELADLLPEIVFETDERGVVRFANARVSTVLGYSPEDIDAGRSVFEFLVPEQRERAREVLQTLLQTPGESKSEYLLVRKDGSTLPGIVHSSTIVRNGHAEGVRGVAVDLSGQPSALLPRVT